ncbi:HlyD family secretion protein [Microvirga flavescens]|uniref:HlyD family secretion protein n=1 Tax=Microvirga flavescens TaxID=2249811 RepID=UPI000DD5B2EB|nr:HlyD family efflux transporter periplasmic adaptor subunit [Microvirga flavescens]
MATKSRARSVGVALALCLAVTWISGGSNKAASAPEAFEALLRKLQGEKLPEGIAKANGRLEAEQVDVATKIAGRLDEVLVEEGQMVDAGEVVARIDSREIEAQVQGAEAQLRRAQQLKVQAEEAVTQRDSARALARQELERTEALHQKGFAATEVLDRRRNESISAEAGYRLAVAALDESNSMIEVARADLVRLRSLLNDTILTAPRRGRVQYKLAQSGEVVSQGTRIVTLLDISDVYMTVFVPASVAGRLILGDDARLILDAIPQYIVPAKVTFVAAEAQFTPKSVETADERDKLMFRVKLKIPPDLLRRYESQVKTGLRGIAYMRTSRNTSWPATLQTKLPQ